MLSYTYKANTPFVATYPYLVHVIDENIFMPFEFNADIIAKIGFDLYCMGVSQRMYEACSYALYWSIKYNYTFKEREYWNDAIASNDCIYLLLSYIKAKRESNKEALKQLKIKAESLLVTDFDRYWIFIYEILPQTKISGDFKCLKKNKISFIKPGVL